MNQTDALQNLRERLHRLEHDNHLIQAERDEVRFRTLGVLNTRPRNVGEAKRYITALEHAITQAKSETPF